MIIRNFCQNLYANKLGNLEEMGKSWKQITYQH